ncbi:MAG: AAA family ATPase, partial [Candidatus Eremiobacteraeota bacterium]|nr:AAA family ATPase [Candidatus Eremiobacteraeota bacterium]
MPLLAYLLLHRDRAIARESLAYLLWEDESEEAARTNLRRHLHNLQSALPQTTTPWLLVDSESVQWNPQAPLWLDVCEFERLAATAQGRAQAVELYAGDLLENLYDDWLFAPRERLRNRYLTALGELLLERRSSRRFSEAIEYAQRILLADAWREDAVRQLMAVRHESGDRAGAIRAYEHFANALRGEMQIDPMPETTALRDSIVRNEGCSSDGSTLRPQASVQQDRQATLPFVGRQAELGQLTSLWGRAARRRGCVAFIGGAAGIGKTRLATELSLLVEAEGGRVLYGTTSFPEEAPYQAIRGALRSALPLLPAIKMEPIWRAALGQLLPELQHEDSKAAENGGTDAPRQRLQLFEAMTRALEALAQPRPLLIVLEDLHWAGDATIEALRFLGHRVQFAPIFVIVTYRVEELARSRQLRSLRRHFMAEQIGASIAPHRLDAAAIGEIVHQTPELGERADDVVAELYERSEGNPLFVVHALREIIEAKSPDVPLDLKAAIGSRVERMGERSRLLAEIASVMGGGFDIDVLQATSGWPEDEILVSLDELIDRHLVRETTGRGSDRYAFTHHLVQRVIYENVEPKVRVRRHRRVARVLQSARGGEPDAATEIGRHFELGGEPQEAASYFFAGAQRAAMLYAHEETIDLASRALSLSAKGDFATAALLLRERAHEHRGERAGQLSDLDELERIEADGNDVDLRWTILQRRAAVARALGERQDEARYIVALRRLAQH